MNHYTWGVDGFGRQFICRYHEWTILLCVIPGCSPKECIELLELSE